MEKARINLVSDTSLCSGCGACMAACPKAAITMQESVDGCVYPVIDHESCIRCGRCLQICDFHQPVVLRVPLGAWAAAGRDDALVKRSASGGIFAAIAMRWIADGGMVAGAVMDMDEQGLQVYHLLSDKAEDVCRMQGSKYVQSDAWRCYADVAAALQAGRKVLFSGTPCQVAAIRRFTGDPEDLVTIDLICHGVPPVKMLKEYAGLLGKRFFGKVTNIVFRDKDVGKSFCARIEILRGKRESSLYLRSHDLSFYKLFLEGVNYRENCYHCPYAGLNRVGDLTIGDYWGVEKRHAHDFDSGRMQHRSDWSCVLANSERGCALLEDQEDLLLHPTKIEWVAQDNAQLNHPMRKPSSRNSMLAAWERGGYDAVEADFVRAQGGKTRYAIRLWKSRRRNNKTVKAIKDKKS